MICELIISDWRLICFLLDGVRGKDNLNGCCSTSTPKEAAEVETDSIDTDNVFKHVSLLEPAANTAPFDPELELVSSNCCLSASVIGLLTLPAVDPANDSVFWKQWTPFLLTYPLP